MSEAMATPPDVHEHGRERRKRLTRQALRAAVLELGLERSLAEVSIEAITKRAGVSVRTFFNYFDTKDEAALLDLLTITSDELASFAAGAPASTWADLSTMFADDVTRADGDGAELPRYLELHARNPQLRSRQMDRFARFEAELADAIRLRLGDSQLARFRSRLMAGSSITAVRVGLTQWAESGRRGPVADHLAATFAALAPAFAP